jgi:hypothetical protein
MFDQIKKKNKIIDTSPMLDSETEKILQEYLGPGNYSFDERKKCLIEDGIDLKQWQINMEFILRNIDPTLEPEYENLIIEDNRVFLKKVTPKLKLILQGLKPPQLYYPPFLNDKVKYSWYIAGYPDVLDYFYPSPNYSKGSEYLDEELKKVEKRQAVVDPLMDDLSIYIQKKYEKEIKAKDTDKATLIYLLELKEYYKNTLIKSFLLNKK